MPDDIQRLRKRLEELASRACRRGVYSFSEFLTLAEQATLCGMRVEAPYTLEGGYTDAERKIAVFGSKELCGYRAEPPIRCLRIAPLAPKFAESLTHRDFLGALIGLGIRREVLGDIIVGGNCGYLFCLESIAEYVLSQLTQVRRTAVKAERSDSPPVSAAELPERSQIVVASERLDAVVAAVYKLSRSESQGLFGQDRVFVNGRAAGSLTYSPEVGDTISVRGFGRFVYEGVEGETRKGRLRAEVRIFG